MNRFWNKFVQQWHTKIGTFIPYHSEDLDKIFWTLVNGLFIFWTCSSFVMLATTQALPCPWPSTRIIELCERARRPTSKNSQRAIFFAQRQRLIRSPPTFCPTNHKTKEHLKIKIRSAQNVGKVWISPFSSNFTHVFPWARIIHIYIYTFH